MNPNSSNGWDDSPGDPLEYSAPRNWESIPSEFDPYGSGSRSEADYPHSWIPSASPAAAAEMSRRRSYSDVDELVELLDIFDSCSEACELVAERCLRTLSAARAVTVVQTLHGAADGCDALSRALARREPAEPTPADLERAIAAFRRCIRMCWRHRNMPGMRECEIRCFRAVESLRALAATGTKTIPAQSFQTIS